MDTNVQPGAAAEEASIIGSGIVVHGNIEATIDLQIQGKVFGDVRCGTLILGERGEIRGNVFAERVRLAGTVEGAIETADLAIEATAKVTGDLSYSRIKIATGAVVHGRMTHVPREEAAEPAPLRLVETPREAAAPAASAQPAAPAQPAVQGQAKGQAQAAQKPIYIE